MHVHTFISHQILIIQNLANSSITFNFLEDTWQMINPIGKHGICYKIFRIQNLSCNESVVRSFCHIVQLHKRISPKHVFGDSTHNPDITKLSNSLASLDCCGIRGHLVMSPYTLLNCANCFGMRPCLEPDRYQYLLRTGLIQYLVRHFPIYPAVGWVGLA